LKPPIICQVTGSILTADQVAELLGVPQRWVYTQSRAGRLPTVRRGRYRRATVEAWVAGIEAGIEAQTRAAGAHAAVGSSVEFRSQSAVGTATRSHAATGVRR
jgi:excisionase family DNA binding protein